MSQAAGKGALTLGQRAAAWVSSPTGPKTTHFWGPVANWGFVIAVRAWQGGIHAGRAAGLVAAPTAGGGHLAQAACAGHAAERPPPYHASPAPSPHTAPPRLRLLPPALPSLAPRGSLTCRSPLT